MASLREQDIQQCINKTLRGEDGSLIRTPMLPSCRVCVNIPVYAEEPGTVLRILDSLAAQDADKQLFEAIFIVNNSKLEAEQEAPAFLLNQKVIKLLDYFSLKQPKPLKFLSSKEASQALRIKQSDLIVCCINKSSVTQAPKKNNVGMARNRAGAESVARFLTVPVKEQGVIAISDCDCTFSNNFISELIATFNEHGVNGAAGDLQPELDPDFLDVELLKLVLEASGELKGWSEQILVSGKSFYFEKRDKLDFSILRTGQNMAVTARVFCSVNGFLPVPSSEDIVFGRKVSALPGDVVKNFRYMVKTLARPSQRAGVGSLGRRIKFILDSVENFKQRKAERIYKLDVHKMSEFLFYALHLGKNGLLDEKWLRDLMLAYELDGDGFTTAQIQDIAKAFNEILSSSRDKCDFTAYEELWLEHFYHRFPTVDITSHFIGFL